MKTPTQSYRGMFTLAISALIFALSCSKDADILSEYAISDSEDQLLNGFVVDDVYNISPSGTIIIDVLANDGFENQSNVVITSVSNPSIGTVEINDDNTITYTLGTPVSQTSPTVESGNESSTSETEAEPVSETEAGAAEQRQQRKRQQLQKQQLQKQQQRK